MNSLHDNIFLIKKITTIRKNCNENGEQIHIHMFFNKFTNNFHYSLVKLSYQENRV